VEEGKRERAQSEREPSDLPTDMDRLVGKVHLSAGMNGRTGEAVKHTKHDGVILS
jgi:hypothetical protein